MAFVILGGASLQADLLEATPLQAVVSGGRISGHWGGTAFADASYTVTADAFDIAAPLPQSTLLAQVAFGGDSDANDPVTWQTSLGVLEITASTDAAGTFAIVPEPSTVAALGIAFIPIACRRRFIRA